MKTKSNSLYLVIIVISVIVLLVAGGYAYYQTTYKANVSGNTLSWSFKVNDQTKTFTKDLGNLYPGVSGEIPLELSAVGSNVNVDYEITVAYGSEDLKIKNLKFYSNKIDENNYSDEINETTKLTGSIIKGNKVNKKIYYYWPYGDASSATDDYNDRGKNIKLVITVVGRQA